MEFKFRKNKTQTLCLSYPVPVSPDMKVQLDELKAESGGNIDLNEMTREYWQMLVDKYKSQQKLG